jgi:hypothetical protein
MNFRRSDVCSLYVAHNEWTVLDIVGDDLEDEVGFGPAMMCLLFATWTAERIFVVAKFGTGLGSKKVGKHRILRLPEARHLTVCVADLNFGLL